jgi:hypothetical protein
VALTLFPDADPDGPLGVVGTLPTICRAWQAAFLGLKGSFGNEQSFEIRAQKFAELENQ